MSFPTKEDREKVVRVLALKQALEAMQKDLKPGDRCFSHYRNMKQQWRKERRWTTADAIAKVLFPDDELRAYFLAFMVLFTKEIMPYEEEKLAENGDVE